MTSTTRDKKTDAKSFSLKATAVLFWLIVWQAASVAVGLPLLLPSPLQVAQRLLELCAGADFWLTVAVSLARIIEGFLLGIVVGTAAAAAAWRIGAVRELLSPLLGVLKASPVASFTILALVWIPSDRLATVISFIMVLPLVYHNLLEGISSADKKLLEMARVFGFSNRQKLRYCYLPTVLPFFLSAVRSALGFAWKSGIAAEVLGRPKTAIGRQIYDSKIYLETADLFAWTLVVVVMSMLLERLVTGLVGWIGKRAMRVKRI